MALGSCTIVRIEWRRRKIKKKGSERMHASESSLGLACSSAATDHLPEGFFSLFFFLCLFCFGFDERTREFKVSRIVGYRCGSINSSSRITNKSSTMIHNSAQLGAIFGVFDYSLHAIFVCKHRI